MGKQSVAKVSTRKERLQKLSVELQKGLLERETQVKLTLLAALAGEHVLLLGPPGTAKSELAKRLKEAFVEANYFERLLTRFSVPEELFGPLSIQSLEQDQYKRLTNGYLPQASIAFIDEIFKANSAVLNTLLTVLNERKFDNGNRREDVPLISVVAASNELPDGEELNALYDRFMLRSYVAPVSDESFESLLRLEGEGCDPELSVRLRTDELHEVQRLAEKVELPNSIVQLLKEFREYLSENKINVSDRRWRKIIKLLKVSAFTNDKLKISVYDAWVVPHCLWELPEQFDGLNKFYKTRIAIDADFSFERLTAMISKWEQVFNTEKNKTRQAVNDNGKPLYTGKHNKPVTSVTRKEHKEDADGNPLYVDQHGNETTSKTRDFRREHDPLMATVSNEPYLVQAEHSEAHVEGRVRQIQTLQDNIETFLDRLTNQAESAESILTSHLWADSEILPEINHSLAQAIEQIESLKNKTERIIKGFRSLPVEKEIIDIEIPVLSEDPQEVLEGELVN